MRTSLLLLMVLAVFMLWACGCGEEKTDAPETTTAEAAAKEAAAQDAAYQSREPLFGYIDKTGKWIIPPRFDKAYPFKDGLAIVRFRGNLGVIDRSGAWVLQPKYSWIAPCDGLFRASVYQHSGTFSLSGHSIKSFVDRTGNTVVRFGEEDDPFSEVREFSEGLAAAKVKDGKWGFIDKSGKWVLRPQYSRATPFRDGFAAVEHYRCGVIDRTGKVVVEVKHDFIALVGDGLVVAGYPLSLINLKSGKTTPLGGDNVADMSVWASLPESGIRIETHLPRTGGFSDGRMMLAVSDDPLDGARRYGYVDANARPVIPPRFEYALPFSEGLAAVDFGPTWGYIDTRGETKIEPQFDDAGPFCEGLARVQPGDSRESGYIDAGGEPVIQPRFRECGDFSEGLAAAKLPPAPARTSGRFPLSESGRPLYGYIDEEGEWTIEPRFDEAFEFSEGLAVVKSGRLYGVIDKTGAWVVKPKFPHLGGRKHSPCFREGLLFVEFVLPHRRWTYAFVDKTGDMVIRVRGELDKVREFSGGLAAARKKRGGWGFIDTSGNWAIAPEFAGVTDFLGGVAGACRDGKYGLIDRTGKFVLDPEFDDLVPLHEDRFLVTSPPRLINRKGETVGRIRMDYVYTVRPFHDGRAVAEADSYALHCAYIDMSGRLVMPVMRDLSRAPDFCDGLAVCRGDGGYGYVDGEGTFVIPPSLSEADSFSGGLAFVKAGYKSPGGFIDRTGKWVIPPRFEDAGRFREGLCVAAETPRPFSPPREDWTSAPKDPPLYGYVDLTGNFAILPRFWKASPFVDGVAVVVLRGKFGMIDREGKWIVKPDYFDARYSEGLLWVKTGDSFALLDRAGRMVIEPGKDFAELRPFSEGLAAAKDAKGKWGFIDKSGKWIVEPRFDEVLDFSDGIAAVHLKGKEPGYFGTAPADEAAVEPEVGWGFIDRTGAVVIAPGKGTSTSFSEGFAFISGRPIAFMDKTGKIVFEAQPDDRNELADTRFRDGRALVRNYYEKKYGFIDITGKLAIKRRFEHATPFSGGLAAVAVGENRRDRKYGYIDLEGKMVIQSRFEDASDFRGEYAPVRINGRWGLIDRTGKFVHEPQFEQLGPFSEGLAPAIPASRR